MRPSRFINSKTLDDPNDIVEAGSDQEFDMLSDWSSWELVEALQKLDQQLTEDEEDAWMYRDLCK